MSTDNREAKARGKTVHMGRVNSRERLRGAHLRGCDTADCTYVAFGPDTNLPTVLSWLREVNGQSDLFEGVTWPCGTPSTRQG